MGNQNSFYDVFIRVCKEDEYFIFDYDEEESYPPFLNTGYLEFLNDIPDIYKEIEVRAFVKQLIIVFSGSNLKEFSKTLDTCKNPKRLLQRDKETLERFREFFDDQELPYQMNGTEFIETGINDTFKKILNTFIDNSLKEIDMMQKLGTKHEKDQSLFNNLQIGRYCKPKIEGSNNDELRQFLKSLTEKYNLKGGNNITELVEAIEKSKKKYVS
ncbi:hypothetical protein [Sulfuricurvum sp.]|uniref:hypothetical protein n=1 Tax=Sulfuricurvum sp. TaxID=2025608 RepID=UPI003C384FEB